VSTLGEFSADQLNPTHTDGGHTIISGATGVIVRSPTSCCCNAFAQDRRITEDDRDLKAVFVWCLVRGIGRTSYYRPLALSGAMRVCLWVSACRKRGH